MNAGTARLRRQCKSGCMVSVSFADRTERRSCDSCNSCDELRNQIEVRAAGYCKVHLFYICAFPRSEGISG